MEAEPSGSGSHVVGEVVTTRAVWPVAMGIIAVFAVGAWVGAIMFSTEELDRSRGSTVDVVAIGCRSDVVLVVNAEGLPDDAYELRLLVRDRMLSMTHETTYALAGRQHPRSVDPVNGALLLVVAVPTGTNAPIRYELVGTDSDFMEGGTLLPRSNLPTCIDAT